MDIHRYAYVPVLNLDSGEYSWKILRVVKVWAKPVTYPMGGHAGFSIQYVLENCLRVSQENLITEDNKDFTDIKDIHNKLICRSGFISQTIFAPASEKNLRGKELQELINDSKEAIKFCIDNDEIIGEYNVMEIINEFKN